MGRAVTDLLRSVEFWESADSFVPAGESTAAPRASAAPAAHVLFQTSGSTAGPKWLALSKAALLVSAAAVNHHLGVDRDSIWGLALPIHHVGGFGVATRAFHAGCGFAQFPQRWDAARFTAWAAAENITHASLVPTQVHDLAAGGFFAPGTLRAIVVGGGSLGGETGAAARKLGWQVLASYGMTEAASQIATQGPAEDFRPAPLPVLPHWSARISAAGRLEISGPALFSGRFSAVCGKWEYEPREAEWFATSDLAALAGGNLTPLGRADLRVKVLGELVNLAELEARISGGCIVIAVPDPRAENSLAAVFDAAETLPGEAEKLVAAFNAAAAGFERISRFHLLTHFPRSPLGKPRRAEISRWLAADANG